MRTPQELKNAVTVLMLFVRIIYSLGIAIRNNELLDEKGIEADANKTLKDIK